MTSEAESARVEAAHEQRHLDRAHERLDAQRARAAGRAAERLADGRGGTPQARLERDVMVDAGLRRVEQLTDGAQSLVFGRLDRADGAALHVGRVAVHDRDYEPLVVDWRAPVAAPF